MMCRCAIQHKQRITSDGAIANSRVIVQAVSGQISAEENLGTEIFLIGVNFSEV
jgi:hypothetical protein